MKDNINSLAPNINELFDWFESMMKMWLLSESGEEWDAGAQCVANEAIQCMDVVRRTMWIPVERYDGKDFVSVLGYMTDAGEFPTVRECYRVGGDKWFFPALNECHPISHFMWMPEKKEDEQFV